MVSRPKYHQRNQGRSVGTIANAGRLSSTTPAMADRRFSGRSAVALSHLDRDYMDLRRGGDGACRPVHRLGISLDLSAAAAVGKGLAASGGRRFQLSN